MAKYSNHSSDPRFRCERCGTAHDVQMEHDWLNGNSGTTITITKQCLCHSTINSGRPFYGSIDTTKVKEIKPVAKQFDTTEVKNTALNTIISKVEAVERALFNKAEAIRKVEALHTQHIEDASIALNRVLAESLQSGITEEDFENFLPDYDAELSERLNEVRNIMALANVLEGV